MELHFNEKYKLFPYLFFYFFFTNSYANNKVVFVDIDYLINNSTIGKKIINKLENEDKKNIEILKKRETSLKNIEQEIKKKKNIISNEEFQKEINLLKTKISQFNSEKNIMVKNFKNLKNNELNNVLNEFNKIIQKYMTENSIDIVFDKKNIYIGKGSIDITQNILESIEKQLK